VQNLKLKNCPETFSVEKEFRKIGPRMKLFGRLRRAFVVARRRAMAAKQTHQ
jgi:hypothetical protein